MNEELPKFCDILKNKRAELGMTQIEMAIACNISRRYYQYLESGKQPPSSRTLIKIINRLGLEVNITMLVF